MNFSVSQFFFAVAVGLALYSFRPFFFKKDAQFGWQLVIAAVISIGLGIITL